MPTAKPNQTLDYVVDWDARTGTGETVASSTWNVPAGLTIAAPAPSFTDDSTTIWLTGGTAGTTYVVSNTVVTNQGRTLEHAFYLTVLEGSLTVPDPYCTITQARVQGAVGSDLQVQESIERAMDRVDRFTGERFSPRIMTVQTRVHPDGRAFLPHRLTNALSVTEVADSATGNTYAAASWHATSSNIPGQVDAVGIGVGWVGANILVNGLEPWNRTIHGEGTVDVTATFGWLQTPLGVQEATALLAAAISHTLRPDPDNDPSTPLPQTATTTDPEGNVIPVVPPFKADEDDAAVLLAGGRSTGLRAADGLLVPYRRSAFMLEGV